MDRHLTIASCTTRPKCEIMTPFGRPVVPEEYGWRATCSRGFVTTLSQGQAEPSSDNMSSHLLSPNIHIICQINFQIKRRWSVQKNVTHPESTSNLFVASLISCRICYIQNLSNVLVGSLIRIVVRSAERIDKPKSRSYDTLHINI